MFDFSEICAWLQGETKSLALNAIGVPHFTLNISFPLHLSTDQQKFKHMALLSVSPSFQTGQGGTKGRVDDAYDRQTPV